MATYPTSPRSDLLDWAQVHAAQWAAHASQVGLSGAMAGAYAAAADEYRQAARAQRMAEEEYRAAVRTATEKFERLRALSGMGVRAIRSFAEASASPEAVYVLALLPAPAGPSPLPPPGQPTRIRVDLEPTGAVTIRWRCRGPRGARGTVYHVRRRVAGVAGETAFATVGTVGERRFTDTTIPAGAAGLEYTIQAQRGTVLGPVSLPFTVGFGGRSAPGRREAA